MQQLIQDEDNFMAEYSHSRVLLEREDRIGKKEVGRRDGQLTDGGVSAGGAKNYYSSTP